MNKRFKLIIISLFVLILIIITSFFGLKMYTKSFSPEAVAEYKDGVEIIVNYSSPQKKGRKIFGVLPEGYSEEMNPELKVLVPFGKVWRTGANEATILQTSKDLNFGDQILKAGKYSLWTIPNEEVWTVIFNKETGQWGTNYDETQDILKVEASSLPLTESVENFTISFENQGSNIALVLVWDQTKVLLPFQTL